MSASSARNATCKVVREIQIELGEGGKTRTSTYGAWEAVVRVRTQHELLDPDLLHGVRRYRLLSLQHPHREIE